MHVNVLGLLEEGTARRRSDRSGSIENENELKIASMVTVLVALCLVANRFLLSFNMLDIVSSIIRECTHYIAVHSLTEQNQTQCYTFKQLQQIWPSNDEVYLL